jgi:hypothetical protein
MPDRLVLAPGVHALDDDQQSMALVRHQDVLVLGHLGCILAHALLGLLFALRLLFALLIGEPENRVGGEVAKAPVLLGTENERAVVHYIHSMIHAVIVLR